MQVFFDDNLGDEKQHKIMEEISKMEYVENVELHTKEQALAEMKEKFAGNEELLNGYEGENNIFPDSVIIQISNYEKVSEIADKLQEIKGIRRVVSSDNSLNSTRTEIEKDVDKIRKEVYK